jgi:DNA polymerase-1
MPATMVLIDGYAVAYRQFFALPVESMSTRSGEPTNAVFGFTRVLMDVLQRDRPDYLAVSFDMGLSGREVLFGDYKGTREKMPEELRSQLEKIDRVVRAFNIPVLALEGYEADDVIGTVAAQAPALGVRVRVISGDRDLLQLLSPLVTVQLPSRGGPDRVWDEALFREEWGIEPGQLVDLKALMGDSSDNIPGVRGIGEKTATSLLQKYGTLEAVYQAVEAGEIGGANGRKLMDGREMAFVSQRLARILTDVPLKWSLQACAAHDYEVGDVLEVFDQLNFRTLRERLVKLATPVQQSLFGDMDKPVPVQDGAVGEDEGDADSLPAGADANEQFELVVVQDEAAFASLLEVLGGAQRIAIDTETTGLNPMESELVGISLCVDDKVGYYIPLQHREGVQLPFQRVVDGLRPALTDPHKGKVMHNVTFDLVILRRYGIDVAPVTFDPMVAEWLSNPVSRDLGLKKLTAARLKDDKGRAIYMTELKELIGTGKKQITFDRVEIERAAPYAAADAVMTYRLVDVLEPELKAKGLDQVYRELEMPLLPVLVAMEETGVVLDVPYLHEMSGRLAARLQEIEARIHGLSGGYGPFNLNSPKQLSDVLFGKLGLPTKGVPKTSLGYSTDAAVLEELRSLHPIVREILEYRELAKLKGTYVDALPSLISPITGRVHTSYNVTGTSTGRLSSSNPNLQNIPIRTEIGREVRRAFIAPEGKLLLSVDYSQIELRVLAHISGDPTLKQAFYDGQDIHRATAAAVYDIPLDAVTYEQRSFAKRVNFGLIYGMGAFRLARDSDLTLKEAEDFIRIYFARLPEVQAYLQRTKEQARTPEGLTTLGGRRRVFPALMNPKAGRQMIQAEERAAINMPIQGSAADIINRAMIQLYDVLKRERLNAVMTLQVHDELVLEVPEDEVERVRQLVVDVMESAYPLDPPLKANAEVGKNWNDMSA